MSLCVAGAGEVRVLSVVCSPGPFQRLVWSCATAVSSEMAELSRVTGLSRADRRTKAINKLWCAVPRRTARSVRVPGGGPPQTRARPALGSYQDFGPFCEHVVMEPRSS